MCTLAGSGQTIAQRGGGLVLNQTKMRIPQMNSVGSTQKVSETLVQIEGVADIGVNPDEGLLEVMYDPQKTDEAAIRAALSKSGFGPE